MKRPAPRNLRITPVIAPTEVEGRIAPTTPMIATPPPEAGISTTAIPSIRRPPVWMVSMTTGASVPPITPGRIAPSV